MRLWTSFFLAGAVLHFLLGNLSVRSDRVSNARRLTNDNWFCTLLSDKRPQHRGSGRKDLYQPQPVSILLG